MAKMVSVISTATALWERIRPDTTLRRLCGWERLCDVPGESTFFRAFNLRRLICRLVCTRLQGHKEQLVEHISRDATVIAA